MSRKKKPATTKAVRVAHATTGSLTRFRKRRAITAR
jgi:hypothetical protein